MTPTATHSNAGQMHIMIASITACCWNRFPFLRLLFVVSDRTETEASEAWSSVKVFGTTSVLIRRSLDSKPIEVYSTTQLSAIGSPRTFVSYVGSFPANLIKSTGILISFFSFYDAAVLKCSNNVLLKLLFSLAGLFLAFTYMAA